MAAGSALEDPLLLTLSSASKALFTGRPRLEPLTTPIMACWSRA